MADIIQYNNDFENIIAIIEHSKARAIKAVNAEMIEMYWQIGKYISEKAANNGWGKSVVQDFSNRHIPLPVAFPPRISGE